MELNQGRTLRHIARHRHRKRHTNHQNSLTPSGILAYAVGSLVAVVPLFVTRCIANHPLSLHAFITVLRNIPNAVIFICILAAMIAIDLWLSQFEDEAITGLQGFTCAVTTYGLYLSSYLLYWPLCFFIIGVFSILIAFLLPIKRVGPPFATHAWCALTMAGLLFASVMFLVNNDALAITCSSNQIEADTRTSIRNHTELLRRLATEEIGDVDHSELANEMQIIAHLEAEHLGIADSVPHVRIGLSNSDELAHFNSRGNAIVLNAVYYANNASNLRVSVIETISHEMAHAYEWAVVEGRVDVGDGNDSPLGRITQSDIEQWKYELKHPVSPTDDYEEYRVQDIEVRARAYADNRASDYLEALL